MKLITIFANCMFCIFMLTSVASSQPQNATSEKETPVASGVVDSKQMAGADDLKERLELAGDNRAELEKALNDAAKDHRKAVAFLIQNMRRADLETLSADFILDTVRLAYEARETFPWASEVPEEIFFNDVLPFANLDEKRESWRAKLFEICKPLVKDCKTTEEAAQAINQHLFKIVKVKYSRKRKKAIQSPDESIEQGLASCTGLSILLVDACRSVNVPARLAGIAQWTTKRGNHTWAEIWSDGEWHFTGAAEYDPKGLNKGWFVRDASLADKTQRRHSIFAVSFARTDTTFPMVRTRDRENAVFAVNVTDRYTKAKQDAPTKDDSIVVRVRVWNTGRSKRIEMPVEVQLVSDKSSLGQGKSLGDQADMNDMFEVKLLRNTQYDILLGEGDDAKTHRITTDASATQLVEIEMED